MRLAFYYHIPAMINDGKIFYPGFFGLFIDSLSTNVEKLYLLAHTIPGTGEYQLKSSNIQLIDLGPKQSGIHRNLFSDKILKPINDHLRYIDVFLIRSPSPLAPAFSKYIKKGIPVFYYVVGDYSQSADHMLMTSPRSLAIWGFLKWNHFALMWKVKGQKVIVNSIALKNSIDRYAIETCVIPSSTLKDEDFLNFKPINVTNVTRLLYTGRIDIQKGLLELTRAFGRLVHEGLSLELHLVGWEEDPKKPVEAKIKRIANEMEVSSLVYFHGKKQVGKELNEMYRMADIYCIPSYHEGFPRTIWEAMANRLPVITTKVGGIPYFLQHMKSAYLIKPGNVDEIYTAINRLMSDPELRETLISSGFLKAKENTVYQAAKKLIKYIDESI